MEKQKISVEIKTLLSELEQCERPEASQLSPDARLIAGAILCLAREVHEIHMRWVDTMNAEANSKSSPR